MKSLTMIAIDFIDELSFLAASASSLLALAKSILIRASSCVVYALVYCVNLALRSIHQPPITILPHIPFTQVTAYSNSVIESKFFIPDYTVFKGHIKQDPTLLTDYSASLAVGDVKLYSEVVAKDHVDHTDALGWSALGQLLWYCVCRKTRFGFCIFDAKLILVKFVVNRHDAIKVLSHVVARAKSKLSSPQREIPFRGKATAGKRRNTNSATGSTER